MTGFNLSESVIDIVSRVKGEDAMLHFLIVLELIQTFMIVFLLVEEGRKTRSRSRSSSTASPSENRRSG